MKHLAYRILATLIFFTRLPFWRIAEVPKAYYERVVPLWPLAGWLTGGIMALTFWLASLIFPPVVAIIFVFMARVLATGALHEDGFADFCDGFGGGTSRQRTLDIMKDSHIGTYGVLGLILYYICVVAVCYSLAVSPTAHLLTGGHLALLFICSDTFCKWASSTILWFLPYARKENEAKNLLVYANVTWGEKVASLLIGILPFLAFGSRAVLLLPSALASIATCGILFRQMHKRLQGYTGDCCGATFIISECVFYTTLLAYLSTKP